MSKITNDGSNDGLAQDAL